MFTRVWLEKICYQVLQHRPNHFRRYITATSAHTHTQVHRQTEHIRYTQPGQYEILSMLVIGAGIIFLLHAYLAALKYKVKINRRAKVAIK